MVSVLYKLKHYCNMNMSFAVLKYIMLLAIFSVFSLNTYSQSDISRWKAQIAFGFNYPDVDGFVEGFKAKPVNSPTINLGIQHMFTQSLGAKLDYGYNRFSNADDSLEFKTNYSRINAQFVYDATFDLLFLPPQVGTVFHMGPGISIIKPLGSYGNNKHSFFNGVAGIEFHYRIARTISAYVDGSYIFSFSGVKTYNPISEGYGTFNSSLFNITFGVTVSLSGCQYCD